MALGLSARQTARDTSSLRLVQRTRSPCTKTWVQSSAHCINWVWKSVTTIPAGEVEAGELQGQDSFSEEI